MDGSTHVLTYRWPRAARFSSSSGAALRCGGGGSLGGGGCCCFEELCLVEAMNQDAKDPVGKMVR